MGDDLNNEPAAGDATGADRTAASAGEGQQGQESSRGHEDASESWRVLFFPEPCTRAAGEDCRRCAVACPAGAIRLEPAAAARANAVEGDAGVGAAVGIAGKVGGVGPNAGDPPGAAGAQAGEAESNVSAGSDAGGAVARPPLPVVDEAACTRCGICIGICDAFASSEVTTVDFADRMVRRARETGRVYLCCREDMFEGLEPAGNVFVLGCLSALSPEFLAYLFSCGIRVVLCHDAGYCEGCAAGGRFGGRLWRRSVELAQRWTGRAVEVADIIPERERLADKLAAPDRRSLFTGIIGAVGEVASGEYRARKSTVVDDFVARREKMRAAASAKEAAGAYLDDDSREQERRSRFARKILMERACANDPAIAERAPGS